MFADHRMPSFCSIFSPISLFAGLLMLSLACSPVASTDATSDGDTQPTEIAGGDASGEADAGPLTWKKDGVYFTEPFILLAHRGGRRLRPEHTLEAYAHALTFGKAAGGGPDPVAIELDLMPTKDGVPICMHDGEVDRTTDGKGWVDEMTLAELKQLDAGYRFTTDGGKTFPWRGKGLTVPTLAEVLAKFPDAIYTVEIKRNDPPIIDEVLAAFDEIGAMNRTLFSSFDDLQIHAIREKRPDALTSFALIEMVKFQQLKDADLATYEPPAPFALPPWEQLTPELMARMKKVGLRVHPWTVNSAAAMNKMLDLGVDAIFTDDPKLLVQVREARLAREGGAKP